MIFGLVYLAKVSGAAPVESQYVLAVAVVVVVIVVALAKLSSGSSSREESRRRSEANIASAKAFWTEAEAIRVRGFLRVAEPELGFQKFVSGGQRI
jgi:hypothetical protein